MVEIIFDPRAVVEQRGDLIAEMPSYPIKPDDIDASRHLFDAYGNRETEVSAGYIIRMCQERGSWAPFTRSDIENYYRRFGHSDGFTFNQLIEPGTSFFIQEGRVRVGGGWIVEKDGKCFVTTAFVQAAFNSSPAVSSAVC